MLYSNECCGMTTMTSTYMLSLSLVTHSAFFILSRASSTDVYDVATRRLGWNGLYLCFCTSVGSRKGPYKYTPTS